MCQENNKEILKLRHRWEIPMVWISTFITITATIFGACLFFLDESQFSTLGLSADDIEEYASLGFFPLLIIAIYMIRFYQAAEAKANSILVSEQQFPELFKLYQNLAIRLDMHRMPKLYLINGNGVVNAYALECNKRLQYIVIHSEIALLHSTYPEVVEFVLAHELAHHKLNHSSLWRNFINILPRMLGLPGIATSRAQEYSADRVAFSICSHGANAMNLLAVGPWMQQGINSEAWLKQCEEERKEFFVRIVNAMSDHAVLVKRFKALKDLEQQGYSVHGDMF